jgi:hypothetical protein
MGGIDMAPLLCACAWALSAQVPPDPEWKQFVSYGALGLITIWLLWERRADRQADRKSRHEQAMAIASNTTATDKLSANVRQLTDVLWLNLSNSTGRPLLRPPSKEDTPPTNKLPNTH